MKRPWLFAVSTLAGSVAIAVGVTLMSVGFSRVPGVTSANLNQMGGQVNSEEMNHLFLHGGPLQQGLDTAQPQEYLIEETTQTIPGYKVHDFTVHAGQVISILLRNESTVHQKHNWALVRPGSAKRVQEAASKAGPTWQWMPDSQDILAFVPLTQAGESRSVLFRAPSEPGDYPFLCTFPGHGNAMKGVLHVLE